MRVVEHNLMLVSLHTHECVCKHAAKRKQLLNVCEPTYWVQHRLITDIQFFTTLDAYAHNLLLRTVNQAIEHTS